MSSPMVAVGLNNALREKTLEYKVRYIYISRFSINSLEPPIYVIPQC